MDRKPSQQGKIEIRPEVLGGKPVFAGMRIPVELALDFLARNWDFSQLLSEYPSLAEKDLRAAIQFASERVRRERFHLSDTLEEPL